MKAISSVRTASFVSAPAGGFQYVPLDELPKGADHLPQSYVPRDRIREAAIVDVANSCLPPAAILHAQVDEQLGDGILHPERPLVAARPFVLAA